MVGVTTPRTRVIKDWIGLACRLILGGTLLVAGLLKVGDLPSSVQSVRAYKLFGETLVHVIGYGLPIFEIILGLLIIAGVFTRWTALLGALVMFAFIGGIAHAWNSGLAIDCGCFGNGGALAEGVKPKYLQKILRDLGLAACGLWLVVRPRSKFGVDGWIFGTSTASVLGSDLVDDDDDADQDALTEQGSTTR